MGRKHSYIPELVDLGSGVEPSDPSTNYIRGPYRRQGILYYKGSSGNERGLVEFPMTKYFYDKEDFWGGGVTGEKWEFVNSVSGGGSTIVKSVYESSPAGTPRMGILNITSGNAGGNRAGGLLSPDIILFGDGFTRLTFWIRIPTLSTVTNDNTIQIGFIDNITSATITDGIFFRHTSATNNIICVTSNNGTQTATTTGTAFNTNWNRYDIEVNAAGTSVTFYLNKVALTTITTNIPITAGRETSIGHVTLRNAGAARNFFLDGYELLKIGTLEK